MPTVPINSATGFNQTVAPEAALQPTQSISTSADMFGAGVGQSLIGVGQTLGQTGNMLEKHAVQMQNDVNVSFTKDAVLAANQKIQDLLYSTKPDSPGYLTTQGRTALDARADTEQNLMKIRSDALGAIGNPEVKKMVDQELLRRLEVAQTSIGSHAQHQQKNYWNETSQATIQAAKSNAMTDPLNPTNVASAESDIMHEVAQQSSRAGMSPEIDPATGTIVKDTPEAQAYRHTLYQTHISDMYTGMTNRIADMPESSGGGVDAARKFYNSNIAKFTGQDMEKVEKSLGPKTAAVDADALVASVQSGSHQAVTKATVQSADAAGVDPKLAATTMGIESSFGRDPKAGANVYQVQNDTFKGLGGDMSKRGDPTEEQRVGMLALKKAQAVAGEAIGGKPENWQTYLVFQQGVGGGPALLNAKTGENAIDVLTPVYGDKGKATAAIVKNGGTLNMTAQDFCDLIQKKYSNIEGNLDLAKQTDAPTAPVNMPTDPAEALRLRAQQLPGQLAAIESSPAPQRVKDMARNSLIAKFNSDRAALNASQAATYEQAYKALSQPGAKMADVVSMQNQMSPEQWSALGNYLVGKEKDKGYGDGFQSLVLRAASKGGDRLTDPQEVWKAYSEGHLTYPGAKELLSAIGTAGKPDAAAESDMKARAIDQAKTDLSFEADNGFYKIRDPNGMKAFNTQFIPSFYKAYQEGRDAGKSPHQLLSPDSPDYIVGKLVSAYKRTPQQMMQDQMSANAEVPHPQSGVAAKKIDQITDPDELKQWVRATGKKQEGIQRAVQLGLIQAPKPDIAPPVR
ncbi:hypothetical protein CU669_15065 [Paramagnetospirillum kuznetsovii]|uniref:Uncharacterized protein n=1 Tax=Paramagnetospirillum kuznetsovii TaxID=2053833 RepID=A0A364NVZ7_9PROT|nr:hypothetical protein [Paramagnetospirillum kuznetsovii]RAU21075.1 hypothetical protein CU669_15065 [Paramagnetospirillum kuznetsovii]